MRRFCLVVGALAIGVPVAAYAQSQPAENAKAITPADLVGTWSGGPADSTGTPVAGKDTSMTLTMRPDSTYTWTGLPSRSCMSKPNSRWKRLMGTKISWCGGPGYNLTLEGNKLLMTSVQANQGRRTYLVFTKKS